MTTRAIIINNEAWLSTEFGESYARRIFGDDYVNALPRYTKGKRKGLIKGKIGWKKVERGGWYRPDQYSYGYVVKPGKTFGHHIFDPYNTNQGRA